MESMQHAVSGTTRGVWFTAITALLLASVLTLGSVTTVRAATVTATNFTDRANSACATSGMGDCTLREAVIFANANPGTTIQLLAGTYALTIGPSGSDDASTGDVNLTADMTITGAGASSTIIDASGMAPTRDRVLSVANAITAIISGVTIRNGSLASLGNGGGISNNGRLTLNRVSVGDNGASNGGGIANSGGGTITLFSCLIAGNTADASGGGIYDSDGNSSISMFGGQIAANTANFSVGQVNNNGGGGIFNGNGAQAIIDDVLIGDTNPGGANATLAMGGGIFNFKGILTIRNNTRIIGNSSRFFSAGPTDIGGGGIATALATTTVTDTTIASNTAASGGGFNSSLGGQTGSIILDNVIISGNTAQKSGGGIYNIGDAPFTVRNSRIMANSAVGAGGGIRSISSMTVIRSTISGNTAQGAGGGIQSSGTYSVMEITNSTISGNSAPRAGGISSGTSLTLTNVTIVANSSGLEEGTGLQNPGARLWNILLSNNGPNCSGGGPIVSEDHNLSSDGTCTTFTQAHDINTTNPVIGPLANNGGETQTHALLPGSPAIDAGGTSANGCPATDQRGFPRPQGAACDIGAFEFLAPPPPAPRPSDAQPPPAPPNPAPQPRSGIGGTGGASGPAPNPLPPSR
jgi:hypothetical protein